MRTGRIALSALVVPMAITACSDDDDSPSAPAPRVTAHRPQDKPFPTLPCNRAEPRTVRDGKTLACIVTADTNVGRITCSAGELVALYDDGKLKECTLKRAHGYNGVPCKAGATAKWFKSAKLYQCSVEKPYATSGVTCRDRLIYHENGWLHRCELAESAQVGKVEMPANSQVAFDDAGKPTHVKRPAEAPLALESFECAEVEYYRSGGVRSCLTAKDANLSGMKTPAGSRLCFDEQGKPSSDAGRDCVGAKQPARKPR